MAATASITISGTITGLPEGSETIGPTVLSSTAANGTITTVSLAAGDNTITVPTTPAPTGMIIQMPATNTQVTKLKGAAADTGVTLSKTSTHVLTFDSANIPASFILNSAAAQTGLITTIVFF